MTKTEWLASRVTDFQRRAHKIFELWLDDRCSQPASQRELMAIMLGYIVDQTDGRPGRHEAALMAALKTAMDAKSHHKRPDPTLPRTELVKLRQAKFPDMLQKDFAEKLGITRLHMGSIEVGRRQPSLELALRWVQLLAPEAKIEMFGPLPVIEERIRQIKKLQKIFPEIFEAA